MIIDMHTHIFPDKIAEHAVAELESNLPEGEKAFTDGTSAGLIASMREAGVDYSVLLPVVTSPKQFDSVNRFAAELNGRDGIISFGGIHPDNDHIEERITALKHTGFRGIKLHPDFQHVFIDDERMIRIIRACVKQDMMVAIHAGIDVGFPYPVHCPPEKAAHVIDQIGYDSTGGHPHIILAHLGGLGMYDEVEKYLVGKDVYFDLAYIPGKIPSEQLLRIIRTHGADRILFGTDSPWSGQKESISYLRSLPLTEEEKELILWKNASHFLTYSDILPKTKAIYKI